MTTDDKDKNKPKDHPRDPQPADPTSPPADPNPGDVEDPGKSKGT